MDAVKAGESLDIGDTVVMEHAGRWEHSEMQSDDKEYTVVYVERASSPARHDTSDTAHDGAADTDAPLSKHAETESS